MENLLIAEMRLRRRSYISTRMLGFQEIYEINLKIEANPKFCLKFSKGIDIVGAREIWNH